jgi:pectin methylesterase-like acyl-CoA thioesterase
MAQTSNDLNISQAGMVAFDGTATFSGRTLTAGTGITITNGSGVAGNPIISSNGANDLHTALYIVSSAGTTGTGANFTTISAAIAAAQGSGVKSTIFIMPGNTGTYTENFTLPANINLVGHNGDQITPNVTFKINFKSKTANQFGIISNSFWFCSYRGKLK